MKKNALVGLIFAGALALTTATAMSPDKADAAVDNGNGTVTVEAGDTYMSIAGNYGMSVSALEQLNGREVGGYDLIYPGETVSVNGTTQQTTATTTTDTTAQATQTAATTAQTATTQTSF